MRKFLEDAFVAAKTLFVWLGAILVFSSLLLNFYLVGQVKIAEDVQKDNGTYLRFRDSVQLELMDRITDKNNTVRK